MSLKTIQQLLVLSALVWGVVPRWGGPFFAAAWLLLWFGSLKRTRRARALVEQALPQLESVPEPSRALARRFPFAAVWPESANAWGTTWQLSALLCLLLGLAFLAWSLVTFTGTWLLYLPVLAGVLLFSGATARSIKAEERTTQDLKDDRLAWTQLKTLLALRKSLGQWPPEPSPDPVGDKS